MECFPKTDLKPLDGNTYLDLQSKPLTVVMQHYPA